MGDFVNIVCLNAVTRCSCNMYSADLLAAACRQLLKCHPLAIDAGIYYRLCLEFDKLEQFGRSPSTPNIDCLNTWNACMEIFNSLVAWQCPDSDIRVVPLYEGNVAFDSNSDYLGGFYFHLLIGLTTSPFP